MKFISALSLVLVGASAVLAKDAVPQQRKLGKGSSSNSSGGVKSSKAPTVPGVKSTKSPGGGGGSGSKSSKASAVPGVKSSKARKRL
mmetsp:Transcript_2130/g.4829  ORF Transcript_2130/g.4829 Transcript_2130/m.4829 type:complete len:87 (-) Transcript_2130:7-267(-)